MCEPHCAAPILLTTPRPCMDACARQMLYDRGTDNCCVISHLNILAEFDSAVMMASKLGRLLDAHRAFSPSCVLAVPPLPSPRVPDSSGLDLLSNAWN